MKKKIITTFVLVFIMGVFGSVYNEAFCKNMPLVKISQANSVKQTNTKTAPQQKQQTVKQNKTAQNTQAKPINTTSLNVVMNPQKFLNKTVKMQATFDKFSTLGLDYSKALRKSTEYIGILIQRDDVIDHNIPLSEMKLFLTKTMAEKHIDLDTGDKIEITATVFSTALNDAWLDIVDLKVISKVKKDEEK